MGIVVINRVFINVNDLTCAEEANRKLGVSVLLNGIVGKCYWNIIRTHYNWFCGELLNPTHGQRSCVDFNKKKQQRQEFNYGTV